MNMNQNEDDILAVLKRLTEEYKKLKKYNTEYLSKIDYLHNVAELNKAELASVKAELATVKAENTILLAKVNFSNEFKTIIENTTNIVSLFEVENSDLKYILEELRNENNTLKENIFQKN
jgi:hypothetical protein